MNRPERVKALMAAAGRDLALLRAGLGPELCSDEIFGFHLQQAAEKLLKAWLMLEGLDPQFTHDLGALAAQLRAKGAVFEGMEDLLDLTPFASQFRYESYEVVVGLDRAELLAMAGKLEQQVIARVK
jgi:HEPN domain-containing protein